MPALLKKFISFSLVVLIQCLIACQAHACAIISTSPTIESGIAFNMLTCGGDSNSNVSAQIVNADGSLGASYPLTIIKKQDMDTQGGDTFIQAALPVTAPAGQRWRIGVTDSNNVVNTADINLPDVYFTNQGDGVVSGQSITLYGINMIPPGLSNSTNTYLKFVDPNGNVIKAQNGLTMRAMSLRLIRSSSVPAPDEYENTFTVPELTPGIYNLIYSNGLGEVPVSGTVTAYQASNSNNPSPLGLGVWWENQFGFTANVYNAMTDTRIPHLKCDGVTDDTTAFQTALTDINRNGGGTYLLPEGTCLISAGNINLPSNIVIQGAGIGLTTISYGSQYNPSNPPPRTLFYFNGKDMGITGLTIQDNSTGGVPSTDLEIGPGGASDDFVFLKNFELDMPDTTPRTSLSGVNCQYMHHFVAINSNFNSGGSTPVYFHNDENLWLINIEESHRVARFNLTSDSKVVVKNLTINWNTDQTNPTSLESGGMEASTSDSVVIEGSHFNAGINNHVNPVNGLAYDGELLNIQNDGGGNFVDMGTATSATQTTLTDNSKSGIWVPGWSKYTTPYTTTVPSNLMGAPWLLYITDGTDAGDVKELSAKTLTGTLTVSSPFTVVPDQTSKYAVYRSAADHFIVKDNAFNGGSTCVQDWNGSFKSVFVNNTTSNCGSINIRSNQNYVAADTATVTGGNLYDCTTIAPAWKNLIKDNTISNDNEQNQSKVVIDASLWNDCNGPQLGNGMLMFDNKVVGNNLISNDPPLSRWESEMGSIDAGYWTTTWQVCTSGGQQVTCDPNPMLNTGTIFAGNTGGSYYVNGLFKSSPILSACAGNYLVSTPVTFSQMTSSANVPAPCGRPSPNPNAIATTTNVSTTKSSTATISSDTNQTPRMLSRSHLIDGPLI